MFRQLSIKLRSFNIKYIRGHYHKTGADLFEVYFEGELPKLQRLKEKRNLLTKLNNIGIKLRNNKFNRKLNKDFLLHT